MSLICSFDALHIANFVKLCQRVVRQELQVLFDEQRMRVDVRHHNLDDHLRLCHSFYHCFRVARWRFSIHLRLNRRQLQQNCLQTVRVQQQLLAPHDVPNTVGVRRSTLVQVVDELRDEGADELEAELRVVLAGRCQIVANVRNGLLEVGNYGVDVRTLVANVADVLPLDLVMGKVN